MLFNLKRIQYFCWKAIENSKELHTVIRKRKCHHSLRWFFCYTKNTQFSLQSTYCKPTRKFSQKTLTFGAAVELTNNMRIFLSLSLSLCRTIQSIPLSVLHLYALCWPNFVCDKCQSSTGVTWAAVREEWKSKMNALNIPPLTDGLSRG